jgi:hypothetical protein
MACARCWGVLATVCAAIFREVSLKLFGIAVRNGAGEIASRWRCTWLPDPLGACCGCYGLAAWLALGTHVVAGMTDDPAATPAASP